MFIVDRVCIIVYTREEVRRYRASRDKERPVMPRINPNSFATKAVAMDAVMSDELVAIEDEIRAAQRKRDKYLAEHPIERKRLERLRDTAPIYRDNKPFSIFKS
jgi:hypothetical protein